MPRGEPYLGQTRKLIFAIDLGTTYSGVSYSVLDPGEVPEVLSVTRFPGQEGENKSRDTKIPSVLYYDQDGDVCAVGAEAMSEGTRIEAQEEGWTLVEWFKLRLRPSSMQAKGERLPTICVDKSVVQIFADYLAYLFDCATSFICDSHPLGREILESGADVEFVLSHPNGWVGVQQKKMRHAAVIAGLVPDTDAGHARIHFVTEGEASLHFCIVNGLARDVIKAGNNVMIVDAGGGTVDLSTYRIMKTSPVSVVESTAPDCVFEGSTFINSRARTFIEDKLHGSRFGDNEWLDAMLEAFEIAAKPTFRDTTKTSYLRFGGPRDTDEQHGIKRGTLTLTGAEMAKVFEPSIDAIQKAIERQTVISDGQISMVLLVGGFANNPFLRSRLQTFAKQQNLTLFSPESNYSKAVAEGALWFHLDHMVTARIAKSVYGTDCSIRYDPMDPDHIKRRAQLFVQASGKPSLPNGFSKVISRGTLVSEEQEFRAPFIRYAHAPQDRISSRIISYQGNITDPRWMDEDADEFTTLCRVHANVPATCYRHKRGLLGEYVEQEFNVVMLFGLTEMKAQMSWIENGRETRSPAVIVYEGEDDDED